MSKVQYYLSLPCGRPGNDLANNLKHSRGKTPAIRQVKALQEHADCLECAASMLQHVAVLVQAGKIEISQADGQFIIVSADERVGEQLVEDGLLDRMEGDEDHKKPDLKSVH